MFTFLYRTQLWRGTITLLSCKQWTTMCHNVGRICSDLWISWWIRPICRTSCFTVSSVIVLVFTVVSSLSTYYIVLIQGFYVWRDHRQLTVCLSNTPTITQTFLEEDHHLKNLCLISYGFCWLLLTGNILIWFYFILTPNIYSNFYSNRKGTINQFTVLCEKYHPSLNRDPNYLSVRMLSPQYLDTNLKWQTLPM